ncbi:MAG: PAS domain S-box protein [Desulfobacterales bacterium]|jgi:PAS domain S-box-containing protein
MKESETKSHQLDALKHQTEALLHETPHAFSKIPPEDIQQLIHELQAHQIELEIQNNELRQAQLKLAAVRDKYVKLYDFAPVGYFTLDKHGLVEAANLTGANLLAVDRRSLIKRPFTRFIAADFQDIFHQHRQRVVDTSTKQTCELKLIKDDGTEFYGLLESIAVTDAEGNFREIRTVIVDITQLKRAEDAVKKSQSTQHQTDLALQESEEKYRQLFENDSDAVMIFDAETQQFEDANQATLDLYGYSRDEFLTLTVEDLMAAKEKSGSKMIRDGGPFTKRVPLHYFKKKDNTVFPGEISAGRFITRGRQKIMRSVRDITERMNTQEAMRNNEARYRALSEATFEAIFISEKGVCLDVNPRAVELFGYEGDELIGIFGTDVIADESKELVKRHILSGYERPYEAIAQKKDGTKFHVEIRGKMMRYKDKDVRITVIRDIDQQKRTAEALHKSEKRYRELFNSVPIGLYRTTAAGSILDVNPAMLDILGYPDQDTLLQNNSLEIYIDPDDRKLLQRLLEEKGFVHDFTVQLCRHDGRSVWVSINSSIVYDSDSQMTCYEGAMADITERIASEERIHQLSQQLIQAQEDERQMISRELHDTVAQDLSVAKMACDLTYGELLGKQQPEADRIQEICEALQKTIMGVRNMAYELRPPLLEELGLVETIYRFCEDFTQMWGLPVDFQSAGLKNLKLDHTIQINVYRLVQEGLTNIRKHAAAEQATLKLTAAFPNIILRVEDNGRGFDVHARAATTDNEKRMGLRSMQERVALLNGKMKLQSIPGQGTKVFIKLPFTEKKSGAQENHLNR